MDLGKQIANVISWTAERIPGFNGYYKKEKRREQDRLLRHKIVEIMEDIERMIHTKVKYITKTSDLSSLDSLSSQIKRMEKLKDTIQYAGYGYSGFFDVNEIDEEALLSVLMADKNILEWITNFADTMKKGIDIKILTDKIEEGFNLYNQRKALIEAV